jgi:hypothetical protein
MERQFRLLAGAMLESPYMKRFPWFAVATPLLLAGCEDKSPWKPVDNTGVEVRRGTTECQSLAKSEAGYSKKPEELAGIVNDLFITCMRRRGY